VVVVGAVVVVLVDGSVVVVVGAVVVVLVDGSVVVVVGVELVWAPSDIHQPPLSPIQ